ncbi:MAG: carotenoid oxygenase family protein [Elainellaceae cyanobacterium]
MTTTTQANPFLSGNFAPVDDEITTEALTVIGEIPADLNGMLVRNGPNPQFPPKGQYHWFDGDGMVHGVQIRGGQATYRNRYVRTAGFLKEQAEGEALWTGLLEPPQPDLPGGPTKNTANTALVWHAGRFLATWEGGAPHGLQVPSLETSGKHTFEGELQSPVTAHPKVDPVSGEMFFFGYSFSTPYLQYSTVASDGTLQRTVPIELPVGVMMHDFAITERYAIFMDFPLTFRPERMAQGQPGLAFERDRPSRFGVMPRHGTNDDIRWFESGSCYAFHVLNAFEDGDEVVLLAHRSRAFELGGGSPEDGVPYLYQWRFNLASGEVSEGAVSPMPCEFPVINGAYTGRRMRYGYASKCAPTPLPLFDGLIKLDFGDGVANVSPQVHELGPERYCGEAAFALRPGATAEDDGWLLALVHDEAENQSELLILEAQQFSAEPVARVMLPQRVPYGFHGVWLSPAQVGAVA